MRSYSIESNRLTEIAALEDMEKGIELCRKYGVLLGEDLKDRHVVASAVVNLAIREIL